MYFHSYRPISVYCGDKFTTVICYPESSEPGSILHGVLKEISSDNKNNKINENNENNENNGKNKNQNLDKEEAKNAKNDENLMENILINTGNDENQIATVSDEDLKKDNLKSILSLYTEKGYHNHTEKLLLQFNEIILALHLIHTHLNL